jgi:hypothetical protein
MTNARRVPPRIVESGLEKGGTSEVQRPQLQIRDERSIAEILCGEKRLGEIRNVV